MKEAVLDDEVALVVVQAGRMQLAVDAARVLEICPEASWSGSAPLELTDAGGTAEPAAPAGEAGAAEARVLVVRRLGGREPVALRARGAVRVVRVARASAFALPILLRPHVRWVSSVVMSDDQPAILIVDPDELDADAGPSL